MSHQCSCGRDLNNNYVSYTCAYSNTNSGLDRDTNSTMSGKGSGANSTTSSTQLTAKVMFGTVGAIKELREKEKSRHATTRAVFLPAWHILSLFIFIQNGSVHAQVETNAGVSESKTHSPHSPELPKPLHSTLREARQLSEEIDIGDDLSRKPSLMDIALQISARQGLDAMTELYTKIEPDMIRNGQLLEDNHPASLLSKFSAPTVDRSKPNPEMAAFAVITATKAFRKNYKYINDLARQAHTPKISLRRTALESLCPPRDPPVCMPASDRYRTHDGTCNNKRRPRWGAAQMPFNRFLPPVYGDGVDSIRNSVEGGSLSSSRFVSLLVHGAKDGEAPLTLMIAQWGQLLDHDMTSTAQPRSINGSVPSCCGGNDFHPSCFPIKVPLDDPWLAPLKVRCLEFLRSAPAQRRDCVLSWREQTNQATSYIDASPIYSNSAKTSDNARIFRKGLLIYGRGDPSQDVCLRGAMANQCIRSGDGRSSEQPGLLALHHVWVGEHNRIALSLGDLNPHWSDEKIYQETRRIIGAMFQHISYREFLPLILGKEVCKLFDLELLNSGYFDGYSHKINPTVANSFSAAAFRFGHSLIQNSYMRCDRHHNIISNNVSLHEEFQRGDIGSAGSLHRLIRGMATQRALKRDEFITPELTNHLFQTAGFPFGLDLAAINIQRGRDHGIPSYTAWRVPCGLTQVNTWEDFENVVGPESAQRIRHAYRNVHDIDLFVGGIAERPVIGGLVGPTFACIIAQQFSNSRKGDRFWYENGRFESSFTPAQLHSLRRVNLAQVLCRSVGGGTFQPHIFIPADFDGNQRLPCGEGPLAPIDLNAWLEEDPFTAPIPSSNFEHQNPDRVFEISPNNFESTPHTTVHLIKDDKVGFQNRVRPHNNQVTAATSINVPQVNIIPNASTGLHIPKNSTKISDKLDFKRKGTPTSKPSNNHFVNGVNNKLDQNSRITLNIKGVNRHRIHTTTRRTVIVNNVPIELRASDDSTESKTTVDNITETPIEEIKTSTSTTQSTTTKRKKTKKRKNRPKTAKPHIARLDKESEDALPAEDTAEDVLVFHDDELDLIDNSTLRAEDIFDIFDVLTEPPTEIKLLDDFSDDIDMDDAEFREDTEKNKSIDTDFDYTLTEHTVDIQGLGNDIDPLLKTTPITSNKRVQRQIIKNNQINFNKTSNTRQTSRGKPVPAQLISNLTPKNSTFVAKGSISQTNPKLFIRTTTSTTTSSSSTTTTTARPRSKKTTTQSTVELRQYQTRQAYTRPHKVVVKGPNSDAYEIEINIRQTSTGPQIQPVSANNYGYPYENMYKPFTDYDRYSPNYANYVTSTPAFSYYRPPSTVSSTYAQRPTKPPTVIYLNENEYNNDRTTTQSPNIFQNFLNFATNGLRPTSISSINNGQTEKPAYSGNYFPSSAQGSNYGNHQYGSASQAPFPVVSSSLSQTGGVQASSSAITSGNFGAIFGVASANGADSTFSFNIRPKPGASNAYGLANNKPQRPNFGQINSPEYVNLPISSASNGYQESSYQEQSNSPFSTHTQHKRPNSQTYFSKTQVSNNAGVFSSNTDRDYDYSSRMLVPFSNVSSTLIGDNEEYHYEDDSDENLETAKKYDKDGYLRPEHMLAHLLNVQDANERSNVAKNNSSLDDNFVLPKMSNISFGLVEVPKPMKPLQNLHPNLTNDLTNLTETQAKHLNNDIQAENDYVDDTTEPFLTTKTAAMTVIRKSAPGVAFAPINVLTKPERPDNWVIFDIPINRPMLPEPPAVLTDTSYNNEIPRPLAVQSGLWLVKRPINSDDKKEESTTNATPD